MKNDSADDETANLLPCGPAEPEVRTLTSVIIERDDDSDSCTLYPPGAREEVPVTRWVSGTGDAFVDLEDAR